MQHVGVVLDAANVSAIYLLHGTFVGTDALGLIRASGTYMRRIRRALQRQSKHLADAIAGEAGNYTPDYARLFENSLQDTSRLSRSIPVRLFHWSSENHHLGRADAALKLIDELDSLAGNVPPGSRVLLWGHSHAGNVFALITNVLANDAASRVEFFEAARILYRCPVTGKVDEPTWHRVREWIAAPRRPIDHLRLDFVTFGTPIRYGWNLAACGNLLHFVNHRKAASLPEFRVPFPPKLRDVLQATHGDYVQQFGIAGTNIPPGILSWRTWLANRRLGRVLQPGLRRREIGQYLAHGMRVPSDGTTLLVDYGDQGPNLARHLAGHAVYTRKEWLLFHAEETCRLFYVPG